MIPRCAPSPVPSDAAFPARLAAAVGLVLLLVACSGPERDAGGEAIPEYLSFEGEAMATHWRLTLPATDEAPDLAEEVFALFDQVDARMSEWKETSPLSEVNRRAGGRAVPVPEDLRRVLERSLEIAERTGGAFDPTWAALWGLWDFRVPRRGEEPAVPPREEIERRVDKVGWRDVEIDREAGTVRLARRGMVLGLGAVAKGWALERAAGLLEARGVESFLIVGGGQVMAGKGRCLEADCTEESVRPWRVGIRDPRGSVEDLFARLKVTGVSVSTSGDYESYFELDGVRYHHILDPRTGYPARGLRSVTVVSPNATLADALSTALMVLGPREGLELAREWEGVEAVLVTDPPEGRPEVRVTPGLAGRLELLHPPRR